MLKASIYLLIQVQDLAFQASQRIVKEDSENAISLLKELSQNFPLHARDLSRDSVEKELREEIELNQNEALSNYEVCAFG